MKKKKIKGALNRSKIFMLMFLICLRKITPQPDIKLGTSRLFGASVSSISTTEARGEIYRNNRWWYLEYRMLGARVFK